MTMCIHEIKWPKMLPIASFSFPYCLTCIVCSKGEREETRSTEPRTIARTQCGVQSCATCLWWAWELFWQTEAREKINPHHIWYLFTNIGRWTIDTRDMSRVRQRTSTFKRQHNMCAFVPSTHQTGAYWLQYNVSDFNTWHRLHISAVLQANLLTGIKRRPTESVTEIIEVFCGNISSWV